MCKTIFHYMGCSTFSNFTVLPEIAWPRIRPPDAQFARAVTIGCGLTTASVGGQYRPGSRPGSNVVGSPGGGIGLTSPGRADFGLPQDRRSISMIPRRKWSRRCV